MSAKTKKTEIKKTVKNTKSPAKKAPAKKVESKTPTKKTPVKAAKKIAPAPEPVKRSPGRQANPAWDQIEIVPGMTIMQIQKQLRDKGFDTSYANIRARLKDRLQILGIQIRKPVMVHDTKIPSPITLKCRNK